MIRINLLPREEKAQRKAPISFKAGELLIPVAVVAAALLVMAGTGLSQSARISSLQKSIAQIDAESRALAPQIERVNRLAQERAELDLRLGVIAKLEKGRTASVQVTLSEGDGPKFVSVVFRTAAGGVSAPVMCV